GNTSRFSSGSLHCGLITKDFETLNDTLKSFWEIEEIVSTKFVSDELKKCDEHFLKTMIGIVERRAHGKQVPLNENDELVKTLGLSWRPREDTFMYQMNLQEVPVTITKRTSCHLSPNCTIPRTASTDNHKGQNNDSKNLAIKN
ncbi:hypothetical protein TNCT_646511, partial [Trichonephila clavata]